MPFSSQNSKTAKRKIIGDISSSAYHKSKHYTSVPGGVGLLTVSALAFNVLNSYYLQNNFPTINLNQELKFKNTLNSYV
jgi:5,10-methylene-tetrahydrofolate dehydrogenase/methenyl tetrahydrofolate cyclohydrolase